MRDVSSAVVLCLAVAVAGCVSPDAYRCGTDADCAVGGAAGFCEADGRCSVADATCSSGHRYGDSAGDVAGTCVGGDVGVAAGRHCLAGVALPAADACAGQVCATRPWCCTLGWSDGCVHAAETVCELACSGALAATGFTFAGAGEFDGTTFTSRWTAPTSGWAYSTAWGDYDRDGRADLALTREQRTAGMSGVVIHPSSAGGSLLGEAVALGGAEVGSVQSVEWVDHGHDGRLDLLVAGTAGVYLVLQDAGGGFTAHHLTAEVANSAAWIDDDGVAPWRIAVAYRYLDLEDPTPDVPARLVIHQLDGDPPQLDAGAELGQVDGADIRYCQVTGGPARDLVVGGSSVAVAAATSDGFDVPVGLPAGGYRIECADLDRDGDDDVVVAGAWMSPVQVLINQGGLTEAGPVSRSLSTDGVDVGDVDGDHDLDVIVSSSTALDTPLLFLRNTTTTVGDPTFFQSDADDWNGEMWTTADVDLGPR